MDALIDFVRSFSPGTGGRTEAHSMVSGDVSSTRFAETEGHFDRANLKASEGVERYNGAHPGAETEEIQRSEGREETKADSQPKQAPASPDLFGEIASPNSDYETAVKMKTNSRPLEPDETIPKTVPSGLFSEYVTPNERRQDRIVLVQRTPSYRKKEVKSCEEEDDGEGRKRSSLRSSTVIRHPKRLVINSSSSSDTEQLAARPKSRTKKKPNPPMSLDTSSSEDEHVQSVQPRHILKPPKYDGTTSFETFLAQFQNCSFYNKWTKTEELAYLRSSLEKEAGQVLWDYGTNVTNSLKNLTKVLKERFGGANQADKFRIEVRNRRRKDGETLQSLHSDIRRLIALVFPNLDHKAREDIACDYFVDALADPDFALKVRERSPKDLDSALRIALQLEVWTKDVDRIRNEKKETTTKRSREVTGNESLERTIEALRKQNTELQDRLKKVPSNEWRNSSFNSDRPSMIPRRRPVECWGCGNRKHRLWACPNITNEARERIAKGHSSEGASRVRPIQDKPAGTCIAVFYKKRRIRALIDTGSDITLAGTEIAKKYRWKIRTCELRSVTVANGESMIIEGVVNINLLVGNRSVASRIYVTSDMTGLILGIDWLKNQDQVQWDFGENRIRFGNSEWVNLQPEKESDESECRRIYAEIDVVLPPREETSVPVRIVRSSLIDKPFVGVTENRKIPNLSHVYSGRSVIPARFDNIQIKVVNTDNRTQVIAKGTNLGRMEEAEVLEPSPVKPDSASVCETPFKNEDVIHSLITNLPSELTEEQRGAVRQLLQENEAIFSKGEYDIGRTHLVEYRIDTGDHRPIRQPLRRHPFKHLDLIDTEVAKMQEHGIVEPAASPWASNVVLVRKKDGSVRLCIDYRRINSITYKDSYPLPLIDNCLTALSGASWFSTLDLRSGYHNIPIAEEDRDKSAFVTRSGCFRFTVMPFGMTCAPSVFQRLMDFVLCGLSYLTCLVYLDDIIVFGRTFDEQLLRFRLNKGCEP